MIRPPFTACILAGGKSSRMGCDKAGVQFSGTELWRHQLQTIRNIQPDEILISGRNDACYADSDIRIVEDEIKNSGPLAGVASLLSAATHPFILILAIDMPFMTANYLDRLLTSRIQEQGVVPERAGFFEGLAAVFPKKAGMVASKILAGKDHSIQNFVRECILRSLVRTLPVTDQDDPLFRSINFATDLESAGSPNR